MANKTADQWRTTSLGNSSGSAWRLIWPPQLDPQRWCESWVQCQPGRSRPPHCPPPATPGCSAWSWRKRYTAPWWRCRRSGWGWSSPRWSWRCSSGVWCEGESWGPPACTVGECPIPTGEPFVKRKDFTALEQNHLKDPFLILLFQETRSESDLLTSASLEGLWLTSVLFSGASCCTRLRLLVRALVSLANFVHPIQQEV